MATDHFTAAHHATAVDHLAAAAPLAADHQATAVDQSVARETAGHGGVRSRSGFRLIAAAGIAWGTGGAIAAILHRGYGIGPVTVSFWRFAVATAALGAVGVLRRVRDRGRPVTPGSPVTPVSPVSTVSRWRAIVLTGVGFALSQCTYFAAVDDAGVAAATVVTIGASPVFIAIGAHYLLGERFTRRHGAVTAVALIGLALLATGSVAASASGSALMPLVRGGSVGSRPMLGIGLALVSAAGYSAVTLLARAGHARAGDGRGAAPTASIGVFAVAMVCLAPLVGTDVLRHHGSALAAGVWLLFLGTVPTVLAYRWFFAGLGTVPAATASVIVLLEPLSAAIIATLALGEHLTLMASAGGVVLLSTVAVLARAGAQRTGAQKDGATNNWMIDS